MTPTECRERGRMEVQRIAAEHGPDLPAWHSAMAQADWEAEAALTEMKAYQEFIQGKTRLAGDSGFEASGLNSHLFDWQARIVSWACAKGRAAIFADCGLGKTIMQLEWAEQVATHTGGNVLIVCPLAVSEQTVSEGRKFGIFASAIRERSDWDKALEDGHRIGVINYERIDRLDPSGFAAIVLDESSILKAIDGKTRGALTEWSRDIKYRLCCTATPAPNDHTELGNHAEFLGVCRSAEMLAEYFCHDGGETSKWRLKGHAKKAFWKWVCSWAVALKRPSDIGGSDDGFILPPIRYHPVVVASDSDGIHLFPMEAKTMNERRAARKSSLNRRVSQTAAIINSTGDDWVVWCNLNQESEELTDAIATAVEVKGSDSIDHKEKTLNEFSRGEVSRLITKPTIAGFGMNWQHCHKVAFVGLSDSYEQFYQAIRRCWRFGQTKPVDCYIVTAEAEGAVVRNIQRKEKEAQEMMDGMVSAMKEEHELAAEKRVDGEFLPPRSGETWHMVHGDCVEAMKAIPDNSVGFSIFSPPFASLYTYTDDPRDMGNCKDDAEFFDHMRFMLPELFRIMQPGRNVSFHCMDLPMSKQHHGEIALRDFSGLLISEFEKAGFVYHSPRVTIWKDPVTAMQRTKALGLLWKQLKKDSAMSRQGIPDYLVTMRKPGKNENPIDHTASEFPVDQWQEWASPVWMDINPSDTLQFRSARADEDERHICPLQLEVIRRALVLWSKAGDTVFSPFAGIGSEGHEALKAGRKFIGVELKQSYFEQACRNLEFIEHHATAQGSLFASEQTA